MHGFGFCGRHSALRLLVLSPIHERSVPDEKSANAAPVFFGQRLYRAGVRLLPGRKTVPFSDKAASGDPPPFHCETMNQPLSVVFKFQHRATSSRGILEADRLRPKSKEVRTSFSPGRLTGGLPTQNAGF
jgi:hypothetical protein